MISPDLEKTFHQAANLAQSMRHDMIGLEHVLLALLDNRLAQDILQGCGGDLVKIRQASVKYLEDIEKVPEHCRVELEQTLALTRVLQRAVLHVQSAGKLLVDAGDVLAALYAEQQSYAVYILRSQGIDRLDIVSYISHGSNTWSNSAMEIDHAKLLPEQSKETSRQRLGEMFLQRYTINLMEKARQGEIDQLVGRDQELLRALVVLSRRRKNNPLFVGEPGVGKTALAEGLALRIACKQNIPDFLRHAEIFSLDLGALLAGTKFRGEFESRLKAILDALTKRPFAIVFIDEIHTLVGAGAVGNNALDAANLLKPALASGKLRCMGATTYQEYQNIFEKDKALSRRFLRIDIKEPSMAHTKKIIQSLKTVYEKHHGVHFTAKALRATVDLAARYLRDRHFPDKAIDILDEAGAKACLRGGQAMQRIDSKFIAKMVAQMAQVPAAMAGAKERDGLAHLASRLKASIFGQDAAIDQVVSSVKLARAGLGDKAAPIGCFLLAGPTGVGKTELAKQLAQGLGIKLLRFDMSEYMERHSVARLIGAPPGYVGSEQGGLLVNLVKKYPHAVVLLDEIEKAHPDIFNVLLQVMDDASLTLNNGDKADFRNTLLLMTTNAGTRERAFGSIGFNEITQGDTPANLQADKMALERLFSPEFRNRLDHILYFSPLGRKEMEKIVDKMLGDLQAQLVGKKIKLHVNAQAREYLIEQGSNPQYGARPLRRLINKQLRLPLADHILFGNLAHGGTVSVVMQGEKIGVLVETPVKKVAVPSEIKP